MSDQLSAPRDPGAYSRRRRGLGVGAVVLFGLACLAGGYALANFGPQLYPTKPRTGMAPALSVETFAPPAALPEAPATSAPAPVEAAPPAPDAAMAQRLEVLEADRARLNSAAASTLAAGVLMQAAQGSRPFAQEVKALAAVAPSLDLRALTVDAERGAPSRWALAASFPDYAARAASAARAPGEGAGIMARITYALSRVVALRRIGDVPGSSADAVLARAERQVEDGDIVAALATLEALPPSAQDALAPWRDRAERRAKIDREISRLRDQALGDLARSAG
ncbi:COG4223 family protein [Phenylobacterium koreense]|uniref:Uncharacterized protein n=1 Tax=Phenylobacterium koreense TaxID=266125 RepID=A0ABV2EHE9_9CAUL